MDSDIAIGVAWVIFSVLTALFNLILVITILCTRQLRLSSKYIIILVLCICNLITGLFEYSISADRIIHHRNNGYTTNPSWSLLTAHRVYVPYILATLRKSLVIALFTEFVLSLIIRDARLMIKISISMITCAIVASFVLVFPLIPICHSLNCKVTLEDFHALIVSTYFPQMVVLVFVGITIGYVYLKHRTQFPNFDPEKPDILPMDILIAAAIVVWFSFPNVVYLVTPFSARCNIGDSECGIDMEGLYRCMLLLDHSQTFVVPLVWLSNSQMRKHLRGCLCSIRNGTHREVEMTPTSSVPSIA